MALAEDRALYFDPTQPVEARVEDLLGRMTLTLVPDMKHHSMLNFPAMEETGKRAAQPLLCGFHVLGMRRTLTA